MGYLEYLHLSTDVKKWKFAKEKIIGDQKSIINLTQFEGNICAKHNTAMEQMENHDFDFNDGNVKVLKKITVIKSNSGGKPNKCNQCDFASS